LVWLRDRSFDLRQEIQTIRATPDRAQRAALLAQLEQRAATDQAELATLVTANGGGVLRHYWVLSMLAVEVPPAALPVLRAHRRVRRLVPVRARAAADWVPPAGIRAIGPVLPPIATATDSNNHCVDAARSILQGAALESFGAGVLLVFFDSGIDSDASGAPGGVAGTPTPHPSFRQPPPDQALTRIEKHIRAGTIDCNNIREAGTGFGPPGPFAYVRHWRWARYPAT
jgi:hypothetical protein